MWICLVHVDGIQDWMKLQFDFCRKFSKWKEITCSFIFFLYCWWCVCCDFSVEQAPQEQRYVFSVQRSCFPCACMSSIHFEHWKEIRANCYHSVWHYFQLHAHLPMMNCLFPLLRCAILTPQHYLMLWSTRWLDFSNNFFLKTENLLFIFWNASNFYIDEMCLVPIFFFPKSMNAFSVWLK